MITMISNNEPTANICINKSRLKVYNKDKFPTYYLKKGTTFMIELFNPTTGTILAKISLNGNPIAQGGLVLKPGQRVFLDRYIDVARKFLFDTYEVSNTSEVRKAIEENGDFKVEFFREYIKPQPIIPTWFNDNFYFDTNIGGGSGDYIGDLTTHIKYNEDLKGSNISLAGSIDNLDTTNLVNCSANASTGPTLDALESLLDKQPKTFERKLSKRGNELKSKKKVKKTIETGRVEQGSHSDQKLTTIYMDWESWAFHTVEYKMVPLSQKINTVADVNVKRFCTQCGAKTGKTAKFCSQCGTRV